jgi:flagellar M-ring protein FliF
MLSKFGPLQTIKDFWDKLNSTQRFVTALFVSMSLAVMAVVAVIAARPQTSVLFSNLQPEDSGAIISKLQESKIPYEVDGTAIKVPSGKVHELRMQLAGQGLPQSGNIGFELFDKTSFGMTEFSQRIEKQRALQGELSRTLDEIDGVMESKVMIATPEPSVFSEKDKDPTASVLLKVRPGRTLDPNQIAAIVHLVSSSVENLKPDHVTVTDTNGNLLSESYDDSAGVDPQLSASQLKIKREHESQLQKNIQSMLESVLGANKAVVRVSAHMNFDKTETDQEDYKPLEKNAGVLLSSERTTETYGGGGAGPITVGIKPSANAKGAGSYNRLETNEKYQVSKETRHIVKSPGEIDKLSVAVLVDAKVDPSKLTDIRSAVSAAAGIDVRRGDVISVSSIAFDDSAQKKEDKELQSMERQSTYWNIGKIVGGVLILLLFLFILNNVLKQVKISLPQPVIVQELAQTELAMPEGVVAPIEIGVGHKVQDLAQSQPEEIAQVIRKWMSEN